MLCLNSPNTPPPLNDGATTGCRYNHPYNRVGMPLEFDDSPGFVGPQDRAPCDVFINVSCLLLQSGLLASFRVTLVCLEAWGIESITPSEAVAFLGCFFELKCRLCFTCLLEHGIGASLRESRVRLQAAIVCFGTGRP